MRTYFVLILYVFLSLCSPCFARIFEIDKIIAVVNNQVILNSDVNRVLFYLKQAPNMITVPLKINFLKDKILNKLIVDTLILEEAKKFNITVTDDQVDMMFKDIALKKHVPLSVLKKNIILNNTNEFFNYADYINNIKKSLTIKMLQDYILKNNVHIPEKETYYLLNKEIKKENDLKKIDLKFIILPISSKESDKNIKEKKILIDNISNIINANANFDYFYNKFSIDKNLFLVENISSKPLKNIRELFIDKLNILNTNQILGPVLGKKGFYIVKVNNIENKNIKKIITEFHVQHCFIPTSTILHKEQAKKDIFKIYNNIKTKKYSFEYAVKNFSHDVYSSHKKGDLGWISDTVFDSVFEKFLKNLHTNTISQPIQSKFGWHILKVLETRQIDEKWKREKEKIYQMLLQREIKKEKNNWIEKLKKLSYINKY